MSYEKRWGTPHPGLFIILLDQSGSMEEPFREGQAGGDKRKSDMVATILNKFLNDLIKQNSSSGVVKSRAFVAAIGYGGNGVRSALGGKLASQEVNSLEDLKSNPLEIEKRKKKDIDDTGNEIELVTDFPIWIKPLAEMGPQGTPMVAALKRAHAIADAWIKGETNGKAHRLNYPPIVINVTDGAATDDDYTKGFPDVKSAASALCSLATDDGNVLLYNCHLTVTNEPEVQFPGDEGKVPKDQFQLGKMLYGISSVLPDMAVKALYNVNGVALDSTARGFIFNGDAVALNNMITFATVSAAYDQKA